MATVKTVLDSPKAGTLPASLPSQDIQTVFPLQMDVTSGNILLNVTNGSTVPPRLYSAATVEALKKDIKYSSKIHSTYVSSQAAKTYAKTAFNEQSTIYEGKEDAAKRATVARQRYLTEQKGQIPRVLYPFVGPSVKKPGYFNFNPVVSAYKKDISAEKSLLKAELNKRRDMCGWKKNMLGFWYKARPGPDDPRIALEVLRCNEFEKRGGKLTRRVMRNTKATRKGRK